MESFEHCSGGDDDECCVLFIGSGERVHTAQAVVGRDP